LDGVKEDMRSFALEQMHMNIKMAAC